jgi:hypothetical protein
MSFGGGYRSAIWHPELGPHEGGPKPHAVRRFYGRYPELWRAMGLVADNLNRTKIEGCF